MGTIRDPQRARSTHLTTQATPVAKPGLRLPEFIALLSFITSLTALSIDAVLPALQAIGAALEVANPNNTQLLITLFILGMVIGELIFGPLSDAYGRKFGILAGLLVYTVGTVVAMTAQSLEVVVAGRIIQGIGASGPKVASRALIRDLYEGAAMARIMSFIFTIFILVPMLAPALGQAVLHLAGWRAIFVVFLVSAVISSVWLGIRQPETLPMQRRIPLSPGHLLTNTRQIVRHPKVMAYTVAVGFIFGAFLLYLSTAQALFVDFYDAGDLFPLYFALLSVGIGAASFSNSQLVVRLGLERLSIGALTGLILFSSALLLSALASGGVPGFNVFMTLCLLMFFCIGILFTNLNALAMQSLGRVAGIGASLVSSFSSLIAVLVAASVGRFYDQTALPLAVSFVGAAIIALSLVLATRRSTAGAV